jgi:hypothetical protein
MGASNGSLGFREDTDRTGFVFLVDFFFMAR